MAKPLKISEVAAGAAYLVSLSLLVFLRCRFGERVMGDLFVACGFFWACFWGYGELRSVFFPVVPRPVLTPFFLSAMLGLTVFHQCCVWLRRKQPMEIHGYSAGEPLPFWRCLGNPDSVICRYLQPSVCGLVGFVISKIDTALGYWICAASLIVFCQEQHSRIAAKRQILDAIDNRLASKKLLDAIQARLAPSSQQTISSPVVRTAQHSQSAVADVGKIIERLDPGLRKLLDRADANTDRFK